MAKGGSFESGIDSSIEDVRYLCVDSEISVIGVRIETNRFFVGTGRYVLRC
jgi:hypothetical protein